MSERSQRRIDGEYGRLIYILDKAFDAYRREADAPAIVEALHLEAHLLEAYLLLEDKSNLDKRWVKRRNAWLRAVRKTHPGWKDLHIQYEQE